VLALHRDSRSPEGLALHRDSRSLERLGLHWETAAGGFTVEREAFSRASAMTRIAAATATNSIQALFTGVLL
jgi:hypothetical protein